MTNKKQEIRAKNTDGSELSVSSHYTDTPILPAVDYLAELEKIKPGIIEWIMQETGSEAKSRRDLDAKKINTIGRGQLFGFCFGITSLIATCILAYFQDFRTSSIVGGSTIVTVVLAFIAGKAK